MSDNFSHLPLNIRPAAALSDEERIAHIRRPAWIEYPAAKAVLDKMSDLLTQPQSTRMENMLVIAKPGAGKTSLIDRAERIVYDGWDVTHRAARRPLVKVLMPPRPLEKELLWAMGRALETPAVELTHLEGPRLRDEIVGQLHSLSVRMLVIDEINSVLGGTPREQRNFLQLLRWLSNVTGAGLACFGTPEARYALRQDEQLRSRFVITELPLWRPDGDLQTFINHLVLRMPLRQPSRVVSDQVCRLLATRSSGVTDSICKAITRAAVNAVRSGKEMIDLAGLQDESVWEGTTASPSPYQSKPGGKAQARGASA